MENEKRAVFQVNGTAPWSKLWDEFAVNLTPSFAHEMLDLVRVFDGLKEQGLTSTNLPFTAPIDEGEWFTVDETTKHKVLDPNPFVTRIVSPQGISWRAVPRHDDGQHFAYTQTLPVEVLEQIAGEKLQPPAADAAISATAAAAITTPAESTTKTYRIGRKVLHFNHLSWEQFIIVLTPQRAAQLQHLVQAMNWLLQHRCRVYQLSFKSQEGSWFCRIPERSTLVKNTPPVAELIVRPNEVLWKAFTAPRSATWAITRPLSEKLLASIARRAQRPIVASVITPQRKVA